MTMSPPDSLALLPTGITSQMPAILDDLTATVIGEVVAFQGDREIAARLRTSIEANVSMLTHVMQHAGDLHAIDAPSGAVEFAHWIAQRGIPLSALLRAYNLCTARFYELCLREISEQGPHSDSVIEDARRLSTLLHSYVDHVSERISKSYDAERERWLRQYDVTRADRVRSLLGSEPIDLRQTEKDLRYPLTGNHLGVIAWNTPAKMDGNELLRLQHLIGRFADAFDCAVPPLILPRDNTTVWAWISVPPCSDVDTARELEYLVKAENHVKIAIGDIASSTTGFARTHRQALTSRRVAVLAGTYGAAITPYTDVSSISFLCGDLAAARPWIREVLGGLAGGSEQHEHLRESLKVFLHCGGSFTAAAEQLHCHKNTVQYRIRKAEAIRGYPSRYRQLDLQLALLACTWLGPAALAMDPESGTATEFSASEANAERAAY